MAAEGTLEEATRRQLEAWAQVVVIGGGPAGAVAALLLARAGVRVALVHRAMNDRFLVGEVLPPPARLVMERLGLAAALADPAHLASPGTVSVWGSAQPRATDFLFSPYGDGLHLDRAHFDGALRDSAAAAAARVVPGRWDMPSWAARPGTGAAVAAAGALPGPLFVDGTGRAAAVARAWGARIDRRDRLVAVVGALGRPTTRAGEGADARTYVESVPGGWWYSALLPGGRRIAAFHTDVDLLAPAVRRDPAVWHARLRDTSVIGALVQAEGTSAPMSLRLLAADTRRIRWPRRTTNSSGLHPVAVGDAAMAFDPLSSQGILSAVESAQEALPEILARLHGNAAAIDKAIEQRGDAAELRWSRYLTRLAEAYADEQRWPDEPFWARRLGPPRDTGAD